MAKRSNPTKSPGKPAAGAQQDTDAKSGALDAKDLDKVTGGYQTGGSGRKAG